MGMNISYIQRGNLIRDARSENDPGIIARKALFADAILLKSLGIDSSHFIEAVHNADFIQVKNEKGIRVGFNDKYIQIPLNDRLYSLAKQALTGERVITTPPADAPPSNLQKMVEFENNDNNYYKAEIQRLQKIIAELEHELGTVHDKLRREWKQLENTYNFESDSDGGESVTLDPINDMSSSEPNTSETGSQTHRPQDPAVETQTNPLPSANVGSQADPLLPANTEQPADTAQTQTDPILQDQITLLEAHIKRLQEQAREPTLDLAREGRRMLSIMEQIERELLEQTWKQQLSNMQIDKVRPYQIQNAWLYEQNRQLSIQINERRQEIMDLRVLLSTAEREIRLIKMTHLFKESEELQRTAIELEQAEIMKNLLLNHQQMLANTIKTLEAIKFDFNQDRSDLRKKIVKLTKDLQDYNKLLDEFEAEMEILHRTLAQRQPTMASAAIQTDTSPAVLSSETEVAQPMTPDDAPEPDSKIFTPILPSQEELIERAKRTPSLLRTLARMYWFSLITNIEKIGNVYHISLDTRADTPHPLQEIVGNKIPIETDPRASFATDDIKQRVTPLLKNAVNTKHPGMNRWKQFYLIPDNKNDGRDIFTPVDELRLPSLTQALDDLRAFSTQRVTGIRLSQACRNLSQQVIPLQFNQLALLKPAAFARALRGHQFIALIQNLASLSDETSKQSLATLLLGNNPGEEVNHALPIIQKVVRFYLLTKKGPQEDQTIKSAYEKMKTVMKNLRTLLRPFGDMDQAPAATPATGAKPAGTTPGTEAHGAAPSLPLQDPTVSRELFKPQN